MPAWDPEHLVLLDETGITTDLLRRYARSSRGVRVGDRAPFRRWHSSTRLAGITAPCVIDGPTPDHDVCLAYVTQVLAPTLRPGDVAVLDNLGAYRGTDIRAAVEALGATLRCLPPYSPDFNPIELCSRSSKLSSGRRLREPSTRYATPWPRHSDDSLRSNVRTTFGTAATQPLSAMKSALDHMERPTSALHPERVTLCLRQR
jgi:hypothetical protein